MIIHCIGLIFNAKEIVEKEWSGRYTREDGTLNDGKLSIVQRSILPGVSPTPFFFYDLLGVED